MLCKQAVAAEFNSSIHQFENYILALLADSRDMFHFDNQFTAMKICSGLLAGASQFGYPGSRSFPSTTSRPCVALSISEIFSIASSHLRLKASRTPSLAGP